MRRARCAAGFGFEEGRPPQFCHTAHACPPPSFPPDAIDCLIQSEQTACASTRDWLLSEAAEQKAVIAAAKETIERAGREIAAASEHRRSLELRAEKAASDEAEMIEARARLRLVVTAEAGAAAAAADGGSAGRE